MGRYKYSLNEKIKGYVEFRLSHYNELRRDLQTARNSAMPSTIAKYGAVCSGGDGAGRTTENIGMRLASSPYIRNLEQTIEGISRVLEQRDETDLKLIDLVYWKASHTVEGAALRVGIGKTAAYTRINEIIGRIAEELGYVNA